MPLNLRLVGAALLLLALFAAAAGLAAWRDAGPAASGAFPVAIVGPQGPLFEGTVRVEDATALSALLAAAAEADLVVEVEDYPGMGAYVRAIGPHRAQGSSGWIYEIGRAGAWTPGDRSAEHFPLREGDALRWRWVDEPL